MDGSPAPAALAVAAAAEHAAGVADAALAGDGAQANDARAGRRQDAPLARRRVVRIGVRAFALPSGSGSGRDRHDRAYEAGGFTASTSIGEPPSAAAGLVRRRGDASPGARAVRRRAETRSYWGRSASFSAVRSATSRSTAAIDKSLWARSDLTPLTLS